MAALDLSVVIPNYDGEAWLEACLTSLLSQAEGLAYEVIVVDNASHDGSVGLLERRFPDVHVVVNQTNLGFAQATNRGIARSQGRSILLLNNDTFFRSGLRTMIRFLDDHPSCAAVGPQMLDGEGRPRGSWGYFPTLARLTSTMLFLNRLPVVGSWFHPLLVRPGRSEFSTEAHPVEWASGACLLIARQALEKVGGLDPNYFMYGEDVEWCYRARRAGYSVWALPAAEIVHYGAGGQEWRNWKGPFATLHTCKHFIYFCNKHLPAWQRPVLRLVLAAGAILRLLGSLWLQLSEPRAHRKMARQMTLAYVRVLRIVSGRGTV